VPEQQRRDDAGDHRQDQVGLAEVAALEARRPLHLADDHGPDHAGEHEQGEHVHQQREPALMTQPRQGGLAVDGADHGDHDRREQHEEAPEDGGVDQPRDQALEQLALTEHDLGLVAHTPAQLARAVGGLAHPYELDEQPRAPREQQAGGRERCCQRERSERDLYGECAFLSSAVIAGTISVRSPITA
jgi:hypothetical protein